MESILTPDPSAISAQSLVLHGRTLDVVRAVPREEAGKLKEEREKAREKEDKRNMFLLREGGEPCLHWLLFCNWNLNPPSVILANTPAAESLSAMEIQKRADSYNARRALLASNPSLYVSKTRLSIRHIPTFVTERMLKHLAKHAMRAFEEEVAAGSRTSLSEEESARSGADETRNKGKETRVRQAKIIRQADRVDPLTGKGRSKGYGFLELREHADALRVLRWTNNNPDVPSLLAEWWPAELEKEKKDADPSRAKRIAEAGSHTKHAKGTLIVEFSIENAQVVQRRAARQNVVSQAPVHGSRPGVMTTFRTMLEGRGSYPHQKKRMVTLRNDEKWLQEYCPVKLSLAHDRDQTSNRLKNAKKGGRGGRRNGLQSSKHKRARSSPLKQLILIQHREIVRGLRT